MTGPFSSQVGGERLLLRITCFAIGTIAMICSYFASDYLGLGLTMAAVGWSLVHIVFLEIRMEVHPVLSIIFDLALSAMTAIYAIISLMATIGLNNVFYMTPTAISTILGLKDSTKHESFGLNDTHMDALGIGSEALMGLTGTFHLAFFVIACRDLQNRNRHQWDLTEK